MANLRAVRLEICLISIAAFIAFLHLAATPFFFSIPNRLPTGHDRLGAVASESRLCTQIGIDLLKAGGNAADAAVGTTFCVGVVGMYHSGLGGGGVALVRSSNGTYQSIDFRETAPAAADVDMFKHDVDASLRGGLASGVPGQLRGLEYIHSRYGVLPWNDVLQPAIDVARKGFRVSEDLVKAMGIPSAHDRRRAPEFTDDNRFLIVDPAWAADFAPNGTRLGFGDVMTRKRYADTIEEIARDGVYSFYTGKLASQTVAAIQKAGGLMTMDDLASYDVVIRSPVEISFNGHRVLGCGVPASGAVTLSILKTVEGFGDPDFLQQPYGLEHDILNDSYAASIRERIMDDSTQNVSAYDPNGFEMHNSHGTSQISTLDASGLAISLTTTINLFFGSHLMVPENGIILNNQMNDFSIPGISNVFGYKPSPANYIAPRKRPLSSMSPIIAESLLPGDAGEMPGITVLGSAGGSRIITAVVQTGLHTLLGNLSAYAAVQEPRLHDQLIPNVVTFEWAYDNTTVASMEKKGHEVHYVPPGYSSAHVVRRLTNGTFEAAAETRQVDSAGIVT
ncbi:MAG: hypothetical protein Q9201_000020 [Fulgogasparrea decipioides]